MNVDNTGEFKNALLNLRTRLSQPARQADEQERRRATLAEIEDALRRMEQGSYGICATCRLVIPRGDLLLRPHTAVCSKCRARAMRINGGGLKAA